MLIYLLSNAPVNGVYIFMSNTTTSFLTKYGEWVFRTIVLLGLVANLYLTQNFVTQDTFRKTISQIEAKSETSSKENISAHLLIQTSVSDIATTMKLIAANQVRVDDHEARLRLVESRQIDVLSRVGTLEKVTQTLVERSISKIQP